MLVSGGAGSGIFKSIDGGDSWKEITRNPGLPQQGVHWKHRHHSFTCESQVACGRIVEHEANGGVYRSDDAGATWTFMSGDRNLRQRAWYFSKLYADPKDTNVVYAPNVSPMVSKDGGKTFTRSPGGGDNHDIWIDPTNPARMGNGTRQWGVIFTTDSGKTSIGSVTPTGQYYHVHLNEVTTRITCAARSRTPARHADRFALLRQPAVVVVVVAVKGRRRSASFSVFDFLWGCRRRVGIHLIESQAILTSCTARTMAAAWTC